MFRLPEVLVRSSFVVRLYNIAVIVRRNVVEIVSVEFSNNGGFNQKNNLTIIPNHHQKREKRDRGEKRKTEERREREREREEREPREKIEERERE